MVSGRGNGVGGCCEIGVRESGKQNMVDKIEVVVMVNLVVADNTAQ